MSDKGEDFERAPGLCVRPATGEDVALILQLVKELAEYEKLSHEVEATEETLGKSLFGEQRVVGAVAG